MNEIPKGHPLQTLRGSVKFHNIRHSYAARPSCYAKPNAEIVKEFLTTAGYPPSSTYETSVAGWHMVAVSVLVDLKPNGRLERPPKGNQDGTIRRLRCVQADGTHMHAIYLVVDSFAEPRKPVTF